MTKVFRFPRSAPEEIKSAEFYALIRCAGVMQIVVSSKGGSENLIGEGIIAMMSL